MTVFLVIFSALYFGAQAPLPIPVGGAPAAPRTSRESTAAPLPAVALSTVAADVATGLAILSWRAPIVAAESCALSIISEEKSPRSALQDILHRRDRFIALTKLGSLEKFDDPGHTVRFKRNVQDGSSREPGPLEDEATAAAGRKALASEYADRNLTLKLSCTSGNVSLQCLPDDAARAASVMDALLALDGVRAVQADLPASMRLP